MPTFQSKYTFTKVTCYIPAYYQNLQDWQTGNQKSVRRFKEGDLSEHEMAELLREIKKTVKRRKGEWVITFIPASTKSRYEKRYERLTGYLRKNLDVPVAYFGISIKEEQGGKHEGKGSAVTKENIYIKHHLLKVKDKNIILIDDVITTGESFRTIGDFLIEHGASHVYGVMYSMTIHPFLPKKIKKSK